MKRKKLLTMYRCRDARVWRHSTPDYACEFEALVHESNEEEAQQNAGGRPRTDQAEAVAEIERLIRLNSGSDGDRREPGFQFVRSSVSCLDRMLGQPTIIQASQATLDSMDLQLILMDCQ